MLMLMLVYPGFWFIADTYSILSQAASETRVMQTITVLIVLRQYGA